MNAKVRGVRIANEIRMHLRHQRKSLDTISLQDPIETGRDGAALQLEDAIPDDSCMETNCEQAEQTECLRRGVEQLTGRERQIVRMRYGLAGQPPMTQQEVAAVMGISRSYVSRLETRALAALRREIKTE